MPKKIRQLKAMLSQAGFTYLTKRGKGSHSVWEHPLLRYNVTLAGQDGDDAQRYQEKDVRNAAELLEEVAREESDYGVLGGDDLFRGIDMLL